MFEYRVAASSKDVAELLGAGVRVSHYSYVEDVASATLLVRAGSYGREGNGGVYVLRWRDKNIGVEFTFEPRQDGAGSRNVFTLFSVGTTNLALLKARVPPIALPADEVREATRVACEAAVVYESHLSRSTVDVRVSDPDGGGRELSVTDFNYPEIAATERSPR